MSDDVAACLDLSLCGLPWPTSLFVSEGERGCAYPWPLGHGYENFSHRSAVPVWTRDSSTASRSSDARPHSGMRDQGTGRNL